jgi:integrase
VIDGVKVVLREAVIREELERDPTELVRRVRHKKRERGIFSVEELNRLFLDSGYGPWKDSRDYTCFFLTAVSGVRRGELLVLRWRHINFTDQYLNIDDFLFCYDDGSRVGETWWRSRFQRALRRAQIEPGGRWLTPHSFRHTINTIVRGSGHDPAKILPVLGWMDEEIQDNYTHWEAEHLRRWAEIVDDIWG